jgi:DNA-binding Lrp family transcriptional regulator
MASDTAIKALMAKGFSVRKAAKFMGISPTTAQKAMTRLREQGELISALMSVERDEKLGKLVDHYLDKGIKLRDIKGSDALGAAKLYADRRWPARTEAPAPVRVYADIDLNMFLPDPPDPQPAPREIDLEPGPDEDPA